MRRLVLLALLCGCRGEASPDPPLTPIRNMFDQPRFDMQSGSTLFDDGRTMRPPVEGTISREEETDSRVGRGRLEDESGWVLVVPDEAVKAGGGWTALATRGRDRYDVYCAPCHGLAGDAQGIVSRKGMMPPPTYHQDRLRHMPDGQLYATIENGKGNMPAYGPMMPVLDRWAVVAYVRALQISQAKPEKKP